MDQLEATSVPPPAHERQFSIIGVRSVSRRTGQGQLGTLNLKLGTNMQPSVTVHGDITNNQSQSHLESTCDEAYSGVQIWRSNWNGNIKYEAGVQILSNVLGTYIQLWREW